MSVLVATARLSGAPILLSLPYLPTSRPALPYTQVGRYSISITIMQLSIHQSAPIYVKRGRYASRALRWVGSQLPKGVAHG